MDETSIYVTPGGDLYDPWTGVVSPNNYPADANPGGWSNQLPTANNVLGAASQALGKWMDFVLQRDQLDAQRQYARATQSVGYRLPGTQSPQSLVTIAVLGAIVLVGLKVAKVL